MAGRTTTTKSDPTEPNSIVAGKQAECQRSAGSFCTKSWYRFVGMPKIKSYCHQQFSVDRRGELDLDLGVTIKLIQRCKRNRLLCWWQGTQKGKKPPIIKMQATRFSADIRGRILRWNRRCRWLSRSGGKVVLYYSVTEEQTLDKYWTEQKKFSFKWCLQKKITLVQ